MKLHQNRNSTHNSQSSRIGASPERKTTRSTGNANEIVKNKILAGMGNKSSAGTSRNSDEDDRG